MTHEEAIRELKHQVYKNTDNCEMKISKDCYKATINSLEENTKLKAEIEQLKQKLLDETDKQEFEIERLSNINNSLVKSNDKQNKEIEQLKSEIDRLNTQIAESKAEGVGILYNILELREQNKWLEEQLEKLEKYNSELCMELTITMDKLCLAEKEFERLRK